MAAASCGSRNDPPRCVFHVLLQAWPRENLRESFETYCIIDCCASRMGSACPKSRCLDICATSIQLFKYFAAYKHVILREADAVHLEKAARALRGQNVSQPRGTPFRWTKHVAVEPKPMNFDSLSALVSGRRVRRCLVPNEFFVGLGEHILAPADSQRFFPSYSCQTD